MTNQGNVLEIIGEKEHRNRQKGIIKGFFSELFSYSVDNIGYMIITVMFSFFVIIFNFMPAQEWVNEDKKVIILCLCFVVVSVWEYLTPYIMCKDNNKMVAISDKLKYIPASKSALQQYNLKKLFKYQLKVFVLCMTGQLIAGLIAYKEIALINVLFPVVVSLLLPMIAGIIMIYTGK